MSNIKEFLLCPTNLHSSRNNKLNKLFLGNWCDRNQINQKICNYPWDNKKTLLKDYKYIFKIEKIIFKRLCKYLNDYHDVKESNSYWKIILGPWLTIFTQTIFERWRNFQNAKKYSFKYVINSNRNYKEFVPINFENFYKQSTTDIWNQYIYEDIFKFYLDKKFFLNKKINKKDLDINKQNITHIKIERKLFNFFNFLVSKIFLFRQRKYIICESYLGKFNELKLNLKLGFPSLTLNPVYPDIKKKLDPKRDTDKIFNTREIKKDPFKKYLNSILLKNIPLSFLEQYVYIKNFTEKLDWPTKPKVFFTSHALITKTICSFYLAEKKKIGCKLIHGQHGGYYGTTNFNTFEDLELNVSDKYLTWGWTKPGKNKKKIIKFGILKDKIKLTNENKKYFLIVLKSNSRYTNKIHSGAGSNNLLRYYNDCESFLLNIKNEIKSNIILRRHARRHNWLAEKRICKLFNSKQVDNGNNKLIDLINKSKLVIHTYNSTGFLETLSANKPTIIFFNNNDYPINKNAQKYFSYLEKANILFYNWKEAVSFLNKNYEFIDNWWNDQKTQNARIKFCSNFAKDNNNKLNELFRIITKV